MTTFVPSRAENAVSHFPDVLLSSHHANRCRRFRPRAGTGHPSRTTSPPRRPCRPVAVHRIPTLPGPFGRPPGLCRLPGRGPDRHEPAVGGPAPPGDGREPGRPDPVPVVVVTRR